MPDTFSFGYLQIHWDCNFADDLNDQRNLREIRQIQSGEKMYINSNYKLIASFKFSNYWLALGFYIPSGLISVSGQMNDCV